MTEDQFVYLDGYTRDLADRMGLKDWRVIVAREPNQAEIEGKKAAGFLRDEGREITLHLPDSFADEPADDQRETLVHEFVHCHLSLPDCWVDRLEQHFAPALWKAMHESYHQLHEMAIESLAWVIAPHMPACELPAAAPE